MTPVTSISRTVEIGLRLTGAWPGSSHQILFRLLWMIVLTTAQVFQYWYILTHLSIKDLSDLVESVSTTLPYSILHLKLIILWINRRVFSNIVIAVSKDWTDSSTVDRNVNNMIHKAELSRRFAILIVGVYAVTVILYTGATVEFIRKVGDDDPNIQSRQLLLKMKFPFVSNESPIYECVVFVQFLQLMAVGGGIGTLNALIITLILHIVGQIEIMHWALTEISAKERKHGLSKNTKRFLINKHYGIITLSTNVNKLFSNIALVQFLGNTLTICCIGFSVIISLNTADIKMLVKSIFFYVAVTMEAFIFCFIGEYLSNKSKTIGDAVYESLWYLLKPKDSRMMLLLMVRAQKRLTISAGKFNDLTLESFANVLKASASYMSVLNAMY